MGVPKFYRWISERYPCLSEVVQEYEIPEFDNLYLDMNGIIHSCSHPNDDDPHFRISEEKIFLDIFHYIDVLFSIIKPKKVFFMAVDGVAPRAKMNQQRGRRFRSAKEAEELEKKAVERGEVLPKEDRFDSNCITPGTVFMAKLHEQLKFFVNMKVTNDKLWQGLRIYLSGHETPGEGEHKIMEFIRFEKSQPNYNPNTRHCLYGLDADLIMLGLTSHEPHFSLLREEVRFGSKRSQKRTTTPEEITFHLLHLSLLREYLEWEFYSLKTTMKIPFDLEKIIDDWILMGFLVGNDFIPHLPHLHIAHDALPLLYQTYIHVMPTLDGYINEEGHLNLRRFEKYLRALSKFDYDHFNDTYSDLKWLESKSSKPKNHHAKDSQLMIDEELNKPTENVLETLLNIDDDDYLDKPREILNENEGINSSMYKKNYLSGDEEEEEDEESLFEMEFRQHKRDYYMNKLDFEAVTFEILENQARGYVTAIQWNLFYYYSGICSWSWFYPHHYAPFISDLHNFSDMEFDFKLGKPFLPFQQLLAVLPAASKKLIPKAYQSLMWAEKSPIISYYPVHFKTDLNGKQQNWEAVVLIPFIIEEKLLDAMEPLDCYLTLEERQRNKHGHCLLYTYSIENCGSFSSKLANYIPDINISHAKSTILSLDAFNVPHEKLIKHLCPGVKMDVFFPGFPTFKHINYIASLRKNNINVFGYKSRGDNMIIKVMDEKNEELSKTADRLIGRIVLVGWPHLYEARVISVSDGKIKYLLEEPPGTHGRLYGNFKKPPIREKYLREDENFLWINHSQFISEKLQHNKGIDLGEIKVLVYAEAIQGIRYLCDSRGNVVLEKQWSFDSQPFPLQIVVHDFILHFPMYNKIKTVDELFPPKSTCFMVGFPHYGCSGEVIEIHPDHEGRVRAKFIVPVEPNFENIINRQSELSDQYMSASVIGKRLGITAFLVSYFTGTVLIEVPNKEKGTIYKVNIGLNLKFNKKNKEVPGYSKKIKEGWTYSVKTQNILSQYMEKFPEVFEAVNNCVAGETHLFEDIFPEENGMSVLQQLQNWLKTLSFQDVDHQNCGIQQLDSGVVNAIEEEVNYTKKRPKENKKYVTIQVRPHLLFRPLKSQGRLISDPSTHYRLYDRIVNVRQGYSVPLGLRGTIIGIVLEYGNANDLYEVLFDEEFVGGLQLRCSSNKGYRMPAYAMINLSYGQRKEKAKERKTVAQSLAYSGSLNKMEQTFSQKPVHFEKLNHSPNSPFEFRQGLPLDDIHRKEAYYGCKDSFFSPPSRKYIGYTPTSPNKPQQYKGSLTQYYHKDQKQNCEVDEFQDMWNQLPRSDPCAPGSYPYTSHKDGAMPSLQQAAYALKNTSVNFYPPWPPNASSDHRQYSDRNSKPKTDALKKDQEKRAANADQSNVSSSNREELSSMLASLEVSENKTKSESSNLNMENAKAYDETSSEVLCNLLRIGTHNKNDKKEAPNLLSSHANLSSLKGESKRPHYGRPLSVDELFREAHEVERQHHNKSPPSTNISAASKVVGSKIASIQNHINSQEPLFGHSTGLQSHNLNNFNSSSHQTGFQYSSSGILPQPTAFLQGHHPPGPHTQSKSTYHQCGPMYDLVSFCKMMGLDMPSYQYIQNPNKTWNAAVILGRGLKFETFSMPSKQHAADNAAMIASLRLRSHMVQAMSRPSNSFQIPNYMGQQQPVFPIPPYVVRHQFPQSHSNLSSHHLRPTLKPEQEKGLVRSPYIKNDSSKYQHKPSQDSYKQQTTNHQVGSERELSKTNQTPHSVKPSSTNPFIPLQVTRQQKISVKNASKTSELLKDNDKVDLTQKNGKTNLNYSVEASNFNKNTDNLTNVEQLDTVSLEIKETKIQLSSDAKTSNRKKEEDNTVPKKRPKSRLAIKFGIDH